MTMTTNNFYDSYTQGHKQSLNLDMHTSLSNF